MKNNIGLFSFLVLLIRVCFQKIAVLNGNKENSGW
jgi:hypothetical protein